VDPTGAQRSPFVELNSDVQFSEVAVLLQPGEFVSQSRLHIRPIYLANRVDLSRARGSSLIELDFDMQLAMFLALLQPVVFLGDDAADPREYGLVVHLG